MSDKTVDVWWFVCPIDFKLLPQLPNVQNVTSHPHTLWLPREPLALLTWLGGEEESLVFTRRPNSWPVVCVPESSVCYVATAVRLTRVDISCLSWALVHEKRAVVANRVSAAWIAEFEGTNKGC